MTAIPSDSIVSSLSTGGSHTSSITTVQFRKWNPNINGLCDNLNAGDYVCTSAPGGSYVPPAVSNTNANAATLQRGGGDGSNLGAPTNSTVPTNTTVPPSSSSSGSGSPAPSPTQQGISSSCTKYDQAKKGDYCTTFAQKNGISPIQLYALNGALGSAGQNCATDFWSGYYYCVAGRSTASAAGGTVSTPAPVDVSKSTAMPPTLDAAAPTSTASSTTSGPVPTQSGIASPCARYAEAHTGDTCASFAKANGITPADLYGRNSVLGRNGEKCETEFWVGYDYCVGGTD